MPSSCGPGSVIVKEDIMKVLLAVDHSPQSASAILALSRRPLPEGSVVGVISVVEKAGPPPVGELLTSAGGDLKEYQRLRVAAVETLTKEVAATLEAKGLKVETMVREGHPADAIVEEAKQWGAGLIVMGSHGYRGITRLLLGSVAQEVVNRAPCSVEVVRESGTD
jgi:nucleotide-binding universal stress UspA family protein